MDMLSREELTAQTGIDCSELWDHQPEAISFIVENKKVLIPLPTGTGKTLIALLAKKLINVEPLLVLCSGSALYTWQKHLEKFCPELTGSIRIIEKAPSNKRLEIWNDPNVRVVIAKAKTWAYDQPKITRHFRMGIFDEYHVWFRSRKTKFFTQLKTLTEFMKCTIWMSGTPMSKGRQDLFPILNFCQPKKFGSFWKFINKYCYVVQGMYGMEIGPPRNTPEFRRETQHCIFRPSQELKLPPIVRQTLPIELEPRQRKVYDELIENMIVELDSGTAIITSNVLATITRTRQLLVCPAILDASLGYGAGILNVLEHMEEAEERKHCVWYTPYIAALPWMEKALREHAYPKTVTFRSGMSTDELKKSEEYFRKTKDCIALVSIDFAQSFELESAQFGYFIGYSFDPVKNTQAEGRQRRMTIGDRPINIYYVHNLNTYDDRQLSILNQKTVNTKVDMNDMRAIRQLFTPET